MRLSTLLGHILTTPSIRTGNKGVCNLIPSYLYDEFRDARRACTQTAAQAFPVAAPVAFRPKYELPRIDAFDMLPHWRGEYGINRRKLVRDCWRWAKERGL